MVREGKSHLTTVGHERAARVQQAVQELGERWTDINGKIERLNYEMTGD